MKYYCEVCGKTFESEEKCLSCEKKHREEKERQEILRKEKDSRWNAVKEAYAVANKLYKQYEKDYGYQGFNLYGWKWL